MKWKQVLTEIKQRQGLTQVQIAARVGCSQATICDLYHGRTAEPRYSIGQKLIELANSEAASRHPASAASGNHTAAAGQGD